MPQSSTTYIFTTHNVQAQSNVNRARLCRIRVVSHSCGSQHKFQMRSRILSSKNFLKKSLQGYCLGTWWRNSLKFFNPYSVLFPSCLHTYSPPCTNFAFQRTSQSSPFITLRSSLFITLLPIKISCLEQLPVQSVLMQVDIKSQKGFVSALPKKEKQEKGAEEYVQDAVMWKQAQYGNVRPLNSASQRSGRSCHIMPKCLATRFPNTHLCELPFKVRFLRSFKHNEMTDHKAKVVLPHLGEKGKKKRMFSHCRAPRKTAHWEFLHPSSSELKGDNYNYISVH